MATTVIHNACCSFSTAQMEEYVRQRKELDAAAEAYAAAAAAFAAPAPAAPAPQIGEIYTLVSDEEIERITQRINTGQLRSKDPKSSWTEKHHPSRPWRGQPGGAARIIEILRNRGGRSASKEQLLAALPGWTCSSRCTPGNPYNIQFFLTQLKLQEIIST